MGLTALAVSPFFFAVLCGGSGGSTGVVDARRWSAQAGRAAPSQSRLPHPGGHRRAHLAAVLPTILELRQQGTTQQAIADTLNEQGFSTRRGNRWGQVQVKLALDRAQGTKLLPVTGARVWRWSGWVQIINVSNQRYDHRRQP
jgi:hypothetical protein